MSEEDRKMNAFEEYKKKKIKQKVLDLVLPTLVAISFGVWLESIPAGVFAFFLLMYDLYAGGE